jgi:hypothetical protein
LKLENHHIATTSRHTTPAATKLTCRTQKQHQEQMNSYRKINTNYTKMRLKRTNEISLQANPYVNQALLYFLQQISLNFIKKCPQN